MHIKTKTQDQPFEMDSLWRAFTKNNILRCEKVWKEFQSKEKKESDVVEMCIVLVSTVIGFRLVGKCSFHVDEVMNYY